MIINHAVYQNYWDD